MQTINHWYLAICLIVYFPVKYNGDCIHLYKQQAYRQCYSFMFTVFWKYFLDILHLYGVTDRPRLSKRESKHIPFLNNLHSPEASLLTEVKTYSQ